MSDHLSSSILHGNRRTPSETAGIASVELLQMPANALSNVIGEEGFESLLSRSIRRAGASYPWLERDPREWPGASELEQLRKLFQAREPAKVHAASMLLV